MSEQWQWFPGNEKTMPRWAKMAFAVWDAEPGDWLVRDDNGEVNHLKPWDCKPGEHRNIE